MCHNCEIKGHLSRVCRSKKKPGRKLGYVATMYAPLLCTLGVTAAFPNSLLLPAVIYGVTLTALIDSCSPDSFINQQGLFAYNAKCISNFSENIQPLLKEATFVIRLLEFASFSYTIMYRPGVDNVGPDTLTRAFCVLVTETKLSLKYTMDCVIMESPVCYIL